jgi:hypothetical protein
MIVYSYHPETLDFHGITDAFESPLEPDVFHHPANTTTIEPPYFSAETHSCKFVNGAWLLNERTESPLSNNPTEEELLGAKRFDVISARDKMLNDTDWIIARHQDEMLSESETSLTSDEFKKLLVYRQELRDVTEHPEFPHAKLPVGPSFVGRPRSTEKYRAALNARTEAQRAAAAAQPAPVVGTDTHST